MLQIKSLLLLSCLLLFVGCGGNRITKDNYTEVKTGMTLDEVESILGPGTEQASSDASFGGISITSSHGKVQAKTQIGL